MNTKQFDTLVDSLMSNARLARDFAESIHHLDPAHKHWHGVADGCFAALDCLEDMSEASRIRGAQIMGSKASK